MSVRVNLLPRTVAAKRAERRTTNLTVALVVLLLVVLGGLYILKLNEIQQAEEERDTVQADVSRLEAELASLEQYRQLADELEARNAALAAVMAPEISYARVLNDFSLTFPASSSMRTLSLTALGPEGAAAGEVDGEINFGDAVATLGYEGYSVERYAPGVETVLVEFDKVRSFFSTFIASAQVEEVGDTDVTAYTGTVRLSDEALTRRYADGLPEEIN